MLRLKPKLRTKIQVIGSAVEDYYYVYMPVDGSIKVVNSTALEILKYCDGNHTVLEIVRKLAQEYSIDESKVLDDVIAFIKRAHEEGVLEFT